jgi:hypothetical protein
MDKKNNEKYLYKECNVLSYIEQTKTLLVDFDGIGISFITDKIVSNKVKVRYTGKLGTKDFKCELIR